MGKFLETEKPKQAEYKLTSSHFSVAAHEAGIYKLHPYRNCLPIEYAEENLLPEIRKTALAHFAEHKIKWHDGQNGKPSNHMCDSQVCCVNFLFPFADKPDELAIVLRPYFPDLKEMLPIETGLFVTFEWIGMENYLCEKTTRNGQRSRGANFTSADAAVMFQRTDGKKQIVLIEWKYTESYSPTSLMIAASGTDRRYIYKHLFVSNDCPINKQILPSYDSLFYEPFYQLMRQQLLAHEMEKAHELGADFVSVMHIAPAHNFDFRRVTSRDLEKLGESATDVWKNLVKTEGKFISVNTEQLFGGWTAENLPSMKSWVEYIHARYPWVGEQ